MSLVPREHGSWALLLVPAFVGLGAVRDGAPGAVACFLVLLLAAFLMRAPLLSLVSPAPLKGAWLSLAVLATAALVGLGALVDSYGRVRLLYFTAPALALLAWTLRKGRKPLGLVDELLTVACLSLGAPAGYYAVAGRFGLDAWLLGALCFVFLACPIFHVRAAVAAHRAAADASAAVAWARARRASLIVHAAAFAAVAALCALPAAPWLVAVPYALALAKTSRLAFSPPAKADFKKLGWTEVVYSLVFIACVCAAWRYSVASKS